METNDTKLPLHHIPGCPALHPGKTEHCVCTMKRMGDTFAHERAAEIRRVVERATDAFSRVKHRIADFREMAAANLNNDARYYEGMASGLEIALQEMDRKRYDEELSLPLIRYEAKEKGN